MKILIAKSIMKEKSQLLEPLFSSFAVKKRIDLGEIIEYTVDGPDRIVEPLFDGDKFYFDNEVTGKKALNLSVPGATFAGFVKGEVDTSKVKVAEPKKAEIIEDHKGSGKELETGSTFTKETESNAFFEKPEEEPDNKIKITVKDETQEEAEEYFEVAKSKKIKGKDGKYLEPGAIFTEDQLHADMTTPARMASWHWCFKIED
jgi:hypothetical protein